MAMPVPVISKSQAIKDGMITMKRDGMLKVAEGITTVSEVMRSVFSISLGARNQLRGSHGVPV